MKESTLINIATQYMHVWGANGDYLLDKLASKDIAVEYTHFGKQYQGIEAYRQMLKMTYHFFPDIKIEILEVLAAPSKATVKWRYFGTHKNGNLFGQEANGVKVQVNGLTILEFANDRVMQEYGIVDNLSLLMQLGVLNNKP